MTTYTINYSDSSLPEKTPFVIAPAELDGPSQAVLNPSKNHTSLHLFGQGFSGYGELANENFIKLLENFASTVAPVNPTVGQLWFNGTTNTLNVFTTSMTWTAVGAGSSSSIASATAPLNPVTGQLWFDTAVNTLNVFTASAAWAVVGVPADPEVPVDPPVSGSTLWTWGNGVRGQLGDGTAVSKSSPVRVGSLTNWADVASGKEHSFARKSDGTMWAWGRNSYGQLGDGTRTDKSSPVQVGSLTTWADVVGGIMHSIARKSDGTLWAWGSNSTGQLGDGTPTSSSQSSPVQVGSLTNWADIACGAYHSIARKADGTLWSWGSNSFGILGVGVTGETTSHSAIPVSVGSLTNWAAVSCGWYHSLARKTDGTIWAWGYNGYGQLGDGTITHRSSPVQIGSLTNWAAIAGGSGQSIACKTDGTIWAWGTNGLGSLGDGTASSKSSPVQIGSLTNWVDASCGYSYTFARKVDGTMWAWGWNGNGQLCDGTTTHRSSPIQLGSLTNWTDVDCGHFHVAAIQTT